MELYVRFLPLYMMKVSSWRLQSMTQFVCHKHVRCPHPPSYFIKMTLIFICVNITINNLFSYYWPKTCISGLIIFSHEWEWLFKTECYCTLLIKYIQTIDTLILVCAITVLFLSTQILCPFQNIMNVYHYLKLSYVFENNAQK